MLSWLKRLFGKKSTVKTPNGRVSARFGSHDFLIREVEVVGRNERTPEGRRSYRVKITSDAKDIIPDQLAKLRETFEAGESCELIVPCVGAIQARCVQWEEVIGADRSGTFSAHFVETIPTAA